MPTIVFLGALGAAFGFPVSLFKDLWLAVMEGASPRRHLLVNLAGGALLTGIVCSLLRAFYLALMVPIAFFNWRGFMFGAILGVWLGFYMAASTCPAIGRVRVLGFSTRAIAAGGALGGLFGPLFNWYLADHVLGYNLLPGRFSPLFGIATALAFGVLTWRSPRRR